MDRTDSGPERIVSAALQMPQGRVFTGKTHVSILAELSRKGIPMDYLMRFVDGFTTSRGRFVDREEGYKIAERAGQVAHAKEDQLLQHDDLTQSPEEVSSTQEAVVTWTQAAVLAEDHISIGLAIAEAVLELDDSESVGDIAADFIENEVGRFDWINNWNVISEREDPVERVQQYLDNYAIVADARKVVEYINWLALENPGRWK